MKFDKVDFSNLKLDDTTNITRTCVRPVQKNAPSEVVISADEVQNAVQTLHSLKKENKETEAI